MRQKIPVEAWLERQRIKKQNIELASIKAEELETVLT